MNAALLVLGAIILLVLAVVVAAARIDRIARRLRPVRAWWRRRTGVDYGRHAHRSTPPHGLQMRDPAGGVDWTGPVPVRVPRRR